MEKPLSTGASHHSARPTQQSTGPSGALFAGGGLEVKGLSSSQVMQVVVLQ